MISLLKEKPWIKTKHLHTHTQKKIMNIKSGKNVVSGKVRVKIKMKVNKLKEDIK